MSRTIAARTVSQGVARNVVRTVAQWLDDIEARFTHAQLYFGHGTHNARDEAAWLLTHALAISYADLPDAMNRVVGAPARRLEQLTRERIATRKPLAYLLKEAWLGADRFYVDERAIVPRSFIAEILRDPRAPWQKSAQPIRTILDLCTGSGCLAILAAHRWPEARVDAVDLSSGALAVARRNVREHGVRERVRVIQSDLFTALKDERYDLVLSNPPYVTARAMRALPAEYQREPELALAGGRDGLELVRGIVRQAPTYLNSGAWIVLEIGHNRARMTKAYPTLPLRWLNTSVGSDIVCALKAPWKPAE